MTENKIKKDKIKIFKVKDSDEELYWVNKKYIDGMDLEEIKKELLKWKAITSRATTDSNTDLNTKDSTAKTIESLKASELLVDLKLILKKEFGKDAVDCNCKLCIREMELPKSYKEVIKGKKLPINGVESTLFLFLIMHCLQDLIGFKFVQVKAIHSYIRTHKVLKSILYPIIATPQTITQFKKDISNNLLRASRLFTSGKSLFNTNGFWSISTYKNTDPWESDITTSSLSPQNSATTTTTTATTTTTDTDSTPILPLSLLSLESNTPSKRSPLVLNLPYKKYKSTPPSNTPLQSPLQSPQSPSSLASPLSPPPSNEQTESSSSSSNVNNKNKTESYDIDNRILKKPKQIIRPLPINPIELEMKILTQFNFFSIVTRMNIESTGLRIVKEFTRFIVLKCIEHDRCKGEQALKLQGTPIIESFWHSLMIDMNTYKTFQLLLPFRLYCDPKNYQDSIEIQRKRIEKTLKLYDKHFPNYIKDTEVWSIDW